MSKNSIHDILPPDRRPKRPVVTETNGSDSMNRSFEASTTIKRRKIKGPGSRKSSHLLISIGSIAGVIILGLILSFVFGGAEVTVMPKQETLTVNGDFSAVSVSESDSGKLVYDVMSIESTESSIVQATSKEEVELKASGKIMIYNNYNSADQRLIRNTRFETQDGKIYRIDKSIVVPGKKGETPGSIEVTVYADEPGESYNIGLSDFVIPGFEGTPQYEGFSGRSTTEMTGGFKGEKLVVEDVLLEQTRTLLQGKLKEKLLASGDLQKPDGFVSFDEATFIEFVSEPTRDSGDNVEIIEKGILHRVIFNEAQLAQFIAQNTLGSFGGELVVFNDTQNLIMTIEDKENLEPWNDTVFDFSLNGTTQIEWVYNAERLKQDLSGRNRDAMETILTGYPGIEKAEAVIRPFWSRTFPSDVSEIEIKRVIVK